MLLGLLMMTMAFITGAMGLCVVRLGKGSAVE
jgi:hypothetical protein